jgi:hypothetical protein
METKYLYNWLFHFNDYTNRWSAFLRDDKEAYFGTGGECKSLITSPTIDTLLFMIMKGEGNPEKAKNLINE